MLRLRLRFEQGLGHGQELRLCFSLTGISVCVAFAFLPTDIFRFVVFFLFCRRQTLFCWLYFGFFADRQTPLVYFYFYGFGSSAMYTGERARS